MPIFPYRALKPSGETENAFQRWVDTLDRAFTENPGVEERCDIVRNALAELYYGKPYRDALGDAGGLAHQAAVLSLDPRNATLEPEYYGDSDWDKYSVRKPLIYFWMMYDRSPLGLNHWLGYRVRYMVAKHVLKHLGANVKIFHGVEVSYGYNLTIEDNCTIHKYVLLDDRGEIIIREGTSISDYANVYSHSHDLNDAMEIANERTEIGPRARVTYHGTVMSGVKIGEQALVGSMGVATKDVPPYNISVGVPSRTVKVKTIAPDPLKRAFDTKA